VISPAMHRRPTDWMFPDRPIHVGVLGNFTGEESQEFLPVKDRSFRVITRQNFDGMVASIRPRLSAGTDQYKTKGTPTPCHVRISSLHQLDPQVLERSDELSRVIEQHPKLLLDAKGSQKTRLQLAEEILSQDSAKALKSSWTGLRHLVFSATGNVRIRLLDLSRKRFTNVLKKFKGTAWDQSTLFKLIYEREFDSFGGEPFSLIICDYFFSHLPADVESLGEFSRICAAACCVFVTGASPRLLGREAFDDNDRLSDLDRLFNTGEYAAWRSMRSNEDSRWLSLALPRALLVNTYGQQAEAHDKSRQKPAGLNCEAVWVNAAYLVASNFLTQFSGHYGHVGITAGSGMDLISGLPSIERKAGEKVTRSSVEFDFTTQNRVELEGLGITVLTRFRDTDKVSYTGPLGFGKIEAQSTAYSIRAMIIFSNILHGLKDRLRELKGPLLKLESLGFILNQEIDKMIEALPDRNRILAAMLESVQAETSNPWEFYQEYPNRAVVELEIKIKIHPVRPAEYFRAKLLSVIELA